MSTTLGEDWRTFFDLVLCNCMKPIMFTGSNSFYELDLKEAHMRGKAISTANELIPDCNLTYVEGNGTLLTEMLKNHLKIESPRVCFFGDQYTNDAFFAQQLPGWDGIAVIEELSHAGPDYEEIEKSSPIGRVETNLYKYSPIWGEDYVLHSLEAPQPNYFVYHTSERTRYAVPLIKHITHLMDS